MLKKVCILIFVLLPALLFSQVEEYFVSNANDFIKSSAPFLNGFVFSTPRKIYYIDTNTKRVSEVRNIEERLGDAVITALASHSNTLFIGTSKGVFTVNQGFSVIYELTDKNGLRDPNVTSLYADERHLYIGTRFRGVYVFDYINRVLYDAPISVVNGIVDNFIRDIDFRSFDRIVASYDGFSVFEYTSQFYLGYSSKDYPVLSGTIMSVLPFGDEVFLGTSLGLFLFNRRTEQLRRVGFNSAVFSMEHIGRTLILATYEGIVLLDLETRSYTVPSLGVLREPVACTISVHEDKIFVGFDNKKGTYAVLSYKEPFIRIVGIRYLLKDKVLISLHGSDVKSIKDVDVSLLSLNLGKVFTVKPEVRQSSKNLDIIFAVTNLVDDEYVLNIDYSYEGGKGFVRDVIVVNTKPPSLSFSPIPIFHNQKNIDIIGKSISSDIESVEVLVNGKREIVTFDKTQGRVVASLPLLEGTNNIVFVYRNSFNNWGTNVFVTVVDTSPPDIISADGGRIVERDGRFALRVVDPHVEKIVFSENVSNLTEVQAKDGKEYNFSILSRSAKKIKVVAYDRAGNLNSKEFEVVFQENLDDIVIETIPQSVKVPNLSLSLEFRGRFRRGIVYLQGIPVMHIENPTGRLSTNIQLQIGKNFIRVEGFPVDGKVISRSASVEYVPEIGKEGIFAQPVTRDAAVHKDNLSTEIISLRKENEELKKKVAELEEMIKRLSEGKVIENVVVRESRTIEHLPSLIKVSYSPDVDNFSKVSKRLYGSESFSMYFYYLFRNTSISKLVSERGYIVVPNKKLMEAILRTGDVTVLGSLSALVEWWILRELGKNTPMSLVAKKLNVRFHQGVLISERGIHVVYTPGRDYVVVRLKPM